MLLDVDRLLLMYGDVDVSEHGTVWWLRSVGLHMGGQGTHSCSKVPPIAQAPCQHASLLFALPVHGCSLALMLLCSSI